MKHLGQLEKYISGMVNFSESEMESFLEKTVLKKFRKTEFLVEQGKSTEHVFFINKGLTRNVSWDRKGTEITHFFSMENSFIAEYGAFLNGTSALCSIQCIEDSEILMVPRESVMNGYLTIKEGNKLGRLIAEYYFTSMVQDNFERQTTSLMEQYDRMVEKFPNIHQRVPQHMIASYLGITPVHLSRIKASLKNQKS